MWETATLKYVIGAVCRSLPVTCFCLALVVVPPRTSAGGEAPCTSMTSITSSRNNTVGQLQNKAKTVLSNIQQRTPTTTSLQRRDCLPVSHNSLWIRLNVAEPPTLVPSDTLVPTVAGWPSTRRVVLSANIDRRPRAAPEQPRQPPRRRRRDVDTAIGGGRQRARTRTMTTSSSSSPSTTTTMTTSRPQEATAVVRGSRRRRTLATIASSEISAPTPPSILMTSSYPDSVKSRQINVTRATATDRPLLPEIDKTMIDMPSYGGDGGGDDVMAAAFRQTSWQCRSEPYWRRMPPGTFPPYIQTARCRQTKCMLGLYECVARRYGVKVLRRVDGRCLPVPLIVPAATLPATRNTTIPLNGQDLQLDPSVGAAMYEQAWTFVETQVVVGCDCTKRRDTGAFYGYSTTRLP